MFSLLNSVLSMWERVSWQLQKESLLGSVWSGDTGLGLECERGQCMPLREVEDGFS